MIKYQADPNSLSGGMPVQITPRSGREEARVTEVQVKTSLFVLGTGSPISRKEARDMMEREEMRMLTYQELLVYLKNNPELRSQLSGLNVHTAGEVNDLPRWCRTDKAGNLYDAGTRERKASEDIVEVKSGLMPVILRVREGIIESPSRTDPFVSRYLLDGSMRDGMADVVVGVKISGSEAHRSALESKL